MTRIDWMNGSAAVLCTVAAVVAAVWVGDRPARPAITAGPGPTSQLVLVDLADGRRGVVDAAGNAIPIAPYRRIVSSNSITDWLVTELCEHDQVIAVTRPSAEQAPWRHRFAGWDTVLDLGNIEDLIARKPDLILATGLGDPRRLARLKDAGLVVFDIGEMRGVQSLLDTTRLLGALLDRSERAEILAGRLQRSLDAIAADVPAEKRRTALYIGTYGGKLYGGTVGTNYHDVLRYAGLIDRAAERFRDWPEYSAEQLIALDPDLLVTHEGAGSTVCALPGLDRLRACLSGDGVIELGRFILDDPGFGVVEAAEALHRTVYRPATGRDE